MPMRIISATAAVSRCSTTLLPRVIQTSSRRAMRRERSWLLLFAAKEAPGRGYHQFFEPCLTRTSPLDRSTAWQCRHSPPNSCMKWFSPSLP